MPRNGSGVYSLPTGNPVTDGLPIEASWANNTLNDIANEITQSLPRTGAAPMAGTLGMGGHKIANLGDATVAGDAINLGQLRAMYPVGSVYINAGVSTNPNTLFGFGTWEAFGTGRVLVGIDGADASFDVLGETGGSKDAIAVEHTHTFSTTSGGQSADHSHTGYTDWQGNHQHSIPLYGGPGGDGGPEVSNYGSASLNNTGYTALGGNHQHSVQTYGASNGHTHSVDGTTASTGAAGTNANLQPYVVVHMWRRTA